MADFSNHTYGFIHKIMFISQKSRKSMNLILVPIKAESVLLMIIPKTHFTQNVTCSLLCRSASHLLKAAIANTSLCDVVNDLAIYLFGMSFEIQSYNLFSSNINNNLTSFCFVFASCNFIFLKLCPLPSAIKHSKPTHPDLSNRLRRLHITQYPCGYCKLEYL